MNEFRKEIETVEFFMDLSAATKNKILTGLYADLRDLVLMNRYKTAVRTSKMISLLGKCF